MTVEIKYLGHSAFLIIHNDHSILIDPFLVNSPISVNELNVQDILLTHAHGDHLGDSIEISKEKNATITAIFELANYCSSQGVNANGVNLGGKVPFSWGYAYWLPASHSSSTPEGNYGGSPASILLNIKGVSIYHAGDTGLHYDLKMIGEVYKPDIALLPIGSYYTMGINEAVIAAKWLGSSKVIPIHYNTFPIIQANPEEFKAKIESETKSNCIILKPGELYSV
ncbi:MAG: metal-dependent hydrolase [Candidatus Melainabacteria bacterium RIFOXYA12_FULL_32_12]|nr:MAG: metal-dependent hydrolase [Candidatus Melainabacteria bacterium RIFOXYA2_FULL_32_9]OGI29054.1 MAG: metal-dependent hydrolase [Candidatus Melainabacteria bacterium RIFOXYA12_FULL_32_12]